MAITNLDYQVTTSYRGSDLINMYNVWYFRAVGGTPTAADLAAIVQSALLPKVMDILSSTMTAIGIAVINLVDTGDFHSQSSGLPGTRAGEPLASFVAAGVKVFRSDRAFRNGAKRFGRLSEIDVVGNVFAAGLTANLATLATAMEGTFVGVLDTYKLMIPKRVLQAPVPPATKGKYVLSDLGTIASVGGWTVTSQTSRKP